MTRFAADFSDQLFQDTPVSLRMKLFAELFNCLHADKNNFTENQIQLPFYLFLEFCRHFPFEMSALEKYLQTGFLQISGDFAPVCRELVDLESQIQNKLAVRRSHKSLNHLPAGNQIIRNLRTNSFSPAPQFFSSKAALSPGITLKQQNEACENFLNRILHPLNATISTHFKFSYKALLDDIQSALLVNQTPAILTANCGSEVAQAGECQFTSIEQSLKALGKELTRKITSATQLSEKILTLFNPSPFPRNELITAEISKNWDAAEFLSVNDQGGNQLPFQKVNRNHNSYFQSKSGNFLLVGDGSIPAMGFSQISLHSTKGIASLFQTPLKTGYYFLENNYVKLVVNKNGTLALTDKQNEQTYQALNLFVDTAGGATGLQNPPPGKAQSAFSKSCSPRISLIETGPLRAAIRIRYRMRVPGSSTIHPNSLKTQGNILRIWTTVYLTYNSPMLYFHTRVINTISNHSLAVRFQSGIKDSQVFTGNWQNILPEDNDAPSQTKKTLPDDLITSPFARWIKIVDRAQKRGFTIFSKIPAEFQCLPYASDTISYTLFRSTTQNNLKNSSPTSLNLRELEFTYALVPYNQTREPIQDLQAVYTEQFRAPVFCFPGTPRLELPLAKNLILVKPRILRISILKEAEDQSGMILRLLNPTQKSIKCQVIFGRPVSTAVLTTIFEEPGKQLAIQDKTQTAFTIAAGELASIKFVAVPAG